jgi:hypothetical protein
MPRVNDEYVEGVNNKLKVIQRDLPVVMLGTHPHPTLGSPARSDPAPQPLGQLKILSGSQNYSAGWNLSGRIRRQGEGMHQAFDTEMQRIDGFTLNIGVFLEATDETELENIAAQEFQSYLPGNGPSVPTTTS